MFHVKQHALEAGRTILKSTQLTPSEAAKHGWRVNQDGQRRSTWEYLAYPDITMSDVETVMPEVPALDVRIKTQLGIEATYSSYIERQNDDVAALRREESLLLPTDLDYSAIGGLTNEVKSKLELIRPSTLGQASRIEGVTPGALTALLAFVKRRTDKKKSA